METITARNPVLPHVDAALDKLAKTSGTGVVVCAGDLIAAGAEHGLLRGHGTHAVTEDLRATQCGLVQQVNKLVSVQPLQRRYAAELGDVVVGRVSEIAAKRWKLDLQARQEATLNLSAVNLPGGVQRRRTIEDEMNMRSVYEEGDLIAAEVQSLYADGSVALHTRSLKYGKLQGGQLVTVPCSLVPRQKQHFTSLPDTGVTLILGVNGLIWIGPAKSEEGLQSVQPTAAEAHEQVACIANAVRVLAKLQLSLMPLRIQETYKLCLATRTPAAAMLRPQFLLSVINAEMKRRNPPEH